MLKPCCIAAAAAALRNGRHPHIEAAPVVAAVEPAVSHKKKYAAVGIACAAVAAVAVAGYFLLKKKDIT
ncbi:MAG: hypothetical protein SO063_09795, partial [Eubacteriales bacterium]|nr:hypothetical protein [Eubacteriales bacterium]